MLNVLLQLVTYRKPSVSVTKMGGETTNVSSPWMLGDSMVKSDDAAKSVSVIPVLHETHTRILSDTTRCLSV